MICFTEIFKETNRIVEVDLGGGRTGLKSGPLIF